MSLIASVNELLKQRNIMKKTTTAGTDTIIRGINNEFQSAVHNDSAIANTLVANGIDTTPNQVQEVRLKHGWSRRLPTSSLQSNARRLLKSFHQRPHLKITPGNNVYPNRYDN